VRARAYSRAIIDIGAGDGRYPLHVARTCPDTFAIALEPSLDAVRDAARSLTRRPLSNVALLISSVEAATLDGMADEATIHFPWGTLLAAVLGERADVLSAVARQLKPSAPLRILVSAVDRDGRTPLTVASLEELRGPYADAGLDICEIRAASRADVEVARSSWGKRLDAGRTRPGFVIRCVRRGDEAASVLASGGPDERSRTSHR